MKILCFLIFIYCINSNSRAQQLKKITMYYFGDSVVNVSCGVFKGSTIMLFSKYKLDTIVNFTNNQIGVIVDCPEQYGKAFFKHKNSYELIITKAFSKDYDLVKPMYKEFRRNKIKVYKLKSIVKKE